MDIPILFLKTLVLRPYVFIFLGISLVSAFKLLGWKRTGVMFGITWATAFICEYLSSRFGFPFGNYFYTGSTVGQELYIANVPFFDSLSFTFLLYASYCLALFFVLPIGKPDPLLRWSFYNKEREFSWSVIGVTCLLFMLIDIVIDPVALRGGRWFLGQIYGYPNPGIYFGVPFTNFAGWFFVGMIVMLGYRLVNQIFLSLPKLPLIINAKKLLLGCALYYIILLFNLSVTFWIGESFLGILGCFIYIPVAILTLHKLNILSKASLA